MWPGESSTYPAKVIRSQEFSTADENAEARLRFTREASAAGRLSHFNIVTIHEPGEDRGFPYLVMELVPGNSLEKLMSAGTPVNFQPALSILRPVADALDHAHREGVVHRDIKPANILVRPDGKVKITDFGIARVVSQTLTKTGMTTGTPAYMSPEQIMSSKVDGRADQFSLAVMAYEMLGGRKPFEADAPHTLMMRIMNEEPEPIHTVNPALPKDCSKVFEKALAKSAAARYATCSEFVQALASSLESKGSPSNASVVSGQTPAPLLRFAISETFKNVAPSRRAVVIGVLTVGLLAGSILFIRRGRTTQVPSFPVATVPGAVPDNRPEKYAVIKAELPSAPVATVPVALPDNRPKKGDVKTAELLSVPVATVPVASPDNRPKKADVKTAEVPSVPVATVPVAVPDNRPKQGDVKTNSKDGLRYAFIPGESFQMGCSSGDRECSSGEKPAHAVTISRPFWLGQTEVTVEAYRRFAAATGKSLPSKTSLNPGWSEGKMPMVNVDWNDANGFCSWIGGRLPTETEWEYAARAETTSARYADLNSIAWYAENSQNSFHVVSQKAANSFVVYDMIGNVWEWTADRYGEKYYEGAERTDPAGPPNGDMRVLRGGSWVGDSKSLRSSVRSRSVPTFLSNDIGFRCAWD